MCTSPNRITAWSQCLLVRGEANIAQDVGDSKTVRGLDSPLRYNRAEGLSHIRGVSCVASVGSDSDFGFGRQRRCIGLEELPDAQAKGSVTFAPVLVGLDQGSLWILHTRPGIPM